MGERRERLCGDARRPRGRRAPAAPGRPSPPVTPTALRLLLLPLTLCLLTFAPQTARADWSRQRSGTFAWLHGVFFVDESRGWAVGGKGALLSTDDGGATWRALAPPSEDALRDIFFVDAARGWIVCERNVYLLKEKEEPRSYLLRTDDGGRSWARVGVAGPDVDARLVGVRFADAEHGWAYGEMGALYSTADGGATWARRRVPNRPLLLDAEFLDARRGWLAGAGSTLLRTDDGGATWREGSVVAAAPSRDASRRGASAATRSVRFNAVEFVDERRGWAVGSGGAVYATEDGGRTWLARDSGVESDLYDVKFLDARAGWAVGADGAVLSTQNGGLTWLAETPRTPHTLERLFLANRRRGWAVGFGGTIITFKG